MEAILCITCNNDHYKTQEADTHALREFRGIAYSGRASRGLDKVLPLKLQLRRPSKGEVGYLCTSFKGKNKSFNRFRFVHTLRSKVAGDSGHQVRLSGGLVPCSQFVVLLVSLQRHEV